MSRKAKIGLGLSFGLAVVSVFTIGLLKISAMHGENGDATVGCNYVQRAVRATPGQDIYRTVSVIAYHDYNTDWPGMEAIDSWLKGWEITANCMLDESNLLSYNNIRADRVWFGFGADDGSGFLPTGPTGSGYPCALGAAPDYPGVDYCAGLGRRYSVKQDDGAYIALPDAGRILHCRGYGDIYPGCGPSVYDRGVGTGVGGNCGACNPAYPVSSNAYLGSGFATYPLEDMTSYFGLNAQGRLQDTPISFKVRNTWQGGYRAEAVFTLRYPNTPPQLSCGALTTNPQNPGVGQSFSLRARFSNGSSGEVSNATHPMTITIPPGITPTGSANVNYSPSPLTSSSSGGGVAESVRSGLVATTTGRYTVNWSVSGSNASISCSGEVEIADSPYFRVYGGDVFVGSGFRDQTNTCTPNPDAAILARNRGSATYGGSATQIAAYALRPIEGFATASLRGSPPTRPIGLTFANQPATGYGGNWSSDNVRHCIPDYFAQHTNLAAYQTGATDGAYHSVGNTTLGGRTLNTGDKLSIYVSGDVHITGNITYNQTGSPSAINDIPYFQLVAQGNIYIHPSVTQIDGVLIAQPDPDNANTGTLYTCSNGFTPANRSLVSGSCNDNSLAIYGAVVARQLKFLRSTGSLHTAASNEPHTSANIAERIIFTPEVWLSNPAITQPPREPYEAFTTLPPVL
ncbi:MAG: hypothetical protein U5K77_01285 [Candidatus Saccharibacteria bacterium]|nr:hypothetical protein [Candidatus Saccharibacteria bacterium]